MRRGRAVRLAPAVDLFPFLPSYDVSVYQSGREPIYVTLAAFLVTFALTRGYTRIARVRGWGSAHMSGVHVHHVVVGIVLVIVSGLLLIGLQLEQGFWQLLFCAAFGSGAAFVLDEFALVFHLQDVYWSAEGRSSVDAVVVAVLLSSLLMLHLVPFTGNHDASRWTLVAVLTAHVLVVVVALLKGKLVPGIAGAFVPVLAWVAAIRLARPRSPWSHWFYRRNTRKQQRAQERYDRYQRRWAPWRRRIEDLIGGAPTAG